MNTSQQTDPFAKLKQAWNGGQRIRFKRQAGIWSHWCQKGDDSEMLWMDVPENYEIETLSADKWAAEKAAYKKGEKIEYTRLCVDNGCESWASWWAEVNGPPDWGNERLKFRIALAAATVAKQDPQTPPHYSGPVTPWDLEKCMQSSGSAFVDSRRTDAIEYCFRLKGDLIGDLRKARHCLDEAIRVLESTEPATH